MIEWSKYIYILDVLGIPIHVILSGNNYLLEIVFEIRLINRQYLSLLILQEYAITLASHLTYIRF